MAESLTRNLKEAQAKKELEEHDFRNQINSLLRKIEQLENTITEERAAKKVTLIFLYAGMVRTVNFVSVAKFQKWCLG